MRLRERANRPSQLYSAKVLRKRPWSAHDMYIQNFIVSMRRAYVDNADGCAKSRRNIVAAGSFESIALGLFTGTFYTALVHTAFAGEPSDIRNEYLGWIVSLSFFARALQGFTPFVTKWIRDWKHFYRATRATAYFLQAVLIISTVFLPIPANSKAAWLFCIVFLSETLFFLSNPLLCKWYIGNVPLAIYPDWFSGQQLTITLSTTLAVIMASMIFDGFAGSGKAAAGIVVLRMAALVVGILEMRANSRIRMPDHMQSDRQTSFFETIDSLKKSGLYGNILAISCLWSFVLAFPGQYYTSYLVNNLSQSYTLVNIATIVSIPAFLFMMPVWLLVVQRWGWYIPFGWIALLYAAVNLTYTFVSEGTVYLYLAGMVISQLLLPGANMIAGSLPFQEVPPGMEVAYLGIFNVLCNASRFLGSYLGKGFMTITEGARITWRGVEFVNGQYICAVCAVLDILFVVLIFFVWRAWRWSVSSMFYM